MRGSTEIVPDSGRNPSSATSCGIFAFVPRCSLTPWTSRLSPVPCLTDADISQRRVTHQWLPALRRSSPLVTLQELVPLSCSAVGGPFTPERDVNTCHCLCFPSTNSQPFLKMAAGGICKVFGQRSLSPRTSRLCFSPSPPPCNRS